MTKTKKQKVSFEEYQKVTKELSDKYPRWKGIFDYSLLEFKKNEKN